MKLSGPADSKTDTGFEICPRSVGVIGQNKIQRTYDHDCIANSRHFPYTRNDTKFWFTFGAWGVTISEISAVCM